MAKHFISGVPRYFEPYVCDCFQNALSAQLSHMGQNPGLVLADYLSFMYSEGEGYLGVNYLFKPNTTVEFTEEELNTSLELVYFPLPVQYGTRKGDGNHSDRITVNMYIENDEKKAFKYVKDLIDNDIPAVAAVDLFYMPYHRAWQKEHGLHYVVITGYDEENEFFELFDKYRLSSSDFDGRMSFEQIKLARSSDNPQNNALMGDYKRPLQNIWVQAVIKDGFKPGREKLGRIISESCKRLSGERKILGLSCGIDMLDVFKRDLQERKAEGIDAQNAYMFRTYYNEALKTIARSRKRFGVFINELSGLFPDDFITGTSQLLADSSRYWDISANISLKLAITKSLTLVDNLCEQLMLVKETEKRIAEKLDQNIIQYI